MGPGQPVNQLTKLLHLSVDVAGGSFQLQRLLRHGLSFEFLTWYGETIVEQGIEISMHIYHRCMYIYISNYILYMYTHITSSENTLHVYIYYSM
jgi:hypothetical protein